MAAVDSDHAFTGDETSDSEVVETLIAGRQKRSTAGRNMSSLLDAAADDDLTLLFAEDEHDEEFDEDEGAEGEAEEMSSSEDEDDQGPNAAEDDLEGEKELEKQAKADRKKRKAQESLRLTALRKKVKIDPTVASSVPAAASRPKKKSERISWLPTPEEGPVRSSSRRQTMQNKELTHARLKDSEQRRIKLIATMEEAAKRKGRMKPKVMTQAERLAEAEKVERMNSKSLNRWEEMEKKKAEERKAKLEALQNRRLEGPVMSWWSGVAKWVNGKLVRVGNIDVKPKPDKEDIERKKKTKDVAGQDITKADKQTSVDGQGPQSTLDNPAAEGSALHPPAVSNVENLQKTGEDAALQAKENDKEPRLNGFLDGIHQYASLPASPVPEAKGQEQKTDSADTTTPRLGESASLTDQQNRTEKESQGEIVVTETASANPEEPASVTDRNPAQDESQDKSAELQTANPESGSSNSDTAASAVDGSKSLEESQDKTPTEDVSKPESVPSEPKPTEVAAEENNKPSQDTPDPASNVPAAAENKTAEEEKPVPSSESNPVESTKPTEVVVENATSTDFALQPVTAPPFDVAAAEGLEMNVDRPLIATDPTPESELNIPPQPEVVEQTGRNLLILENFDNATAQSRQYSIYFNSKKPPRLTKISSHLCPITSQPSRYRDCETGLPFASALAYREIRNLTEQKYIWSSMLGCYIGPPTVAAKGVPEEFLTGVKPKKKDQDHTEQAPTGKENEKPAAAVATEGDPMDVDKS